MKELAIIGPTASGKSDLAIKVAKKTNSHILSIDSLSIYKEIDIVSAKPSKEELSEVRHFGIDELYPNEYFSVDIFIDLYEQVKKECKKNNKNLVIVGGTSFYLKSLLQGLSPIPELNLDGKKNVEKAMQDLESTYNFLNLQDQEYMKNISPNDRYRIEKALIIYEGSKIKPSEWFRQNPPKPVINDLKVFNIDVERDVLRDRISKRTSKMLEMGLIDEVAYLEQKYTRSPNSMGAIGIVEVLDYLDGKIDKSEMLSLISTHTAQLAKRQQTFNKNQFEDLISAPLDELEKIILERGLE